MDQIYICYDINGCSISGEKHWDVDEGPIQNLCVVGTEGNGEVF